MSFFKFDETQASSNFELVEEGKYEATIINAVAGLTGTNKAKMTLDFEIRSDVPQNHQGAKVMYNTFTFEHEVAQKIVNSLLKACGFAHGHNFKDAADMANQLIGKHLKITIKHETYDKKMEDGSFEKRTAAKAKYYDKSDVSEPQIGTPIEVGDDDLPF